MKRLHLITSRAILFLVPILRKETDELKIIDQITANTIGIAHLLIALVIAIGGGIIATQMKKAQQECSLAQVVDRSAPDPAFMKLCRQLLDLTGLTLRESWEKYHGQEDQVPM
jgi:hypothetical protein